MNFALYQQMSRPLPLFKGIGSDAVLYHDTSGLILFLQLILWTGFYFYVKTIFVRMLPDWKVFVLLYLQSDKRKQTAGLFRLHRLLYFTRAVCLPTPALATESEWETACNL